MENNSYVLKRTFKIKKNNYSSISSLNSNINRRNLYTYDVDKKEEYPNSLGTSHTIVGSKFQKLIPAEKNGSYILINKNKKFSLNNIQSNNSEIIRPLKEEIWTKILINKAPSYCDNKLEIAKIIRKKRLEKLLDYENFYNNMKTQYALINKRKSELLEDKLNSTNIFNAYSKINNFKSNSTTNIFSDLINYKNKNKSKRSINTDEDIKEKSNKDNLIPNNSYASNRAKNRNIKNVKESSIVNDNDKTGENKDYTGNTTSNNFQNIHNGVLMTLLPLIPRANKAKIKNKKSPKLILGRSQENEEVKLYNFSTQRIENNILLNIDKKTKTSEQFKLLVKNIVKIKYFQNVHKKSLENILLSDKFNVDKKITFLLKLIKTYNNIWIIYRQKINLYLHFLFDKKSDVETSLFLILREKKQIENMIEKLMIQAVKKQQELEELVQIRNFLLQVKLKMKTQPKYFNSLLLRDSHKIELGNILLTSTVGTKNSSVIKFLNSFSMLNLVQLYEIRPTDSLLKLFRKKMNNKRIIPKEFKEKIIYREELLNDENDKKYIPKKGEIFFDKPEQFLDIMINLESKNLFLLQKNDGIKKYSSIIKQEFENNYLSEDKEKESEIIEEILYREKYLLRIKEKNKDLNEQLKMVSSEEFVDNNLYTKKIIQAKANSSFVELSFFKMINYIKILEGYKYYGVLLLEKLITIIKTFIGLKYGNYTLDRCYMFIDELELKNILKLSKKSFNENNKFKVYDYVLQLIKLYDDICEYVKNMQKIYEADENNIVFMRKKKEEVQTMRKITNARETRELLDGERERVIEKILEKWKKPINKVNRIIDDKYNSKMKNKNRNKSVEEVKKMKKETKQNEIDSLIFFE